MDASSLCAQAKQSEDLLRSALYPGDPESLATDPDRPNFSALFADGVWPACVALGKSARDLLGDPLWCRRRTVSLQFIDERRGEWTRTVDALIPDRVKELQALNREEKGVIVPLLTTTKDLLPLAQVTITQDGKDDYVPLESLSVSRRLAHVVLLSAASDAGLCPACLNDQLWKLTSADTIESEVALRDIRGGGLFEIPSSPCLVHPASSGGPSPQPPGRSADLIMLTRIFRRSMYLLPCMQEEDVGKRKVITVRSDGPVRIWRKWREVFGFAPLLVAPRIVFGGEAQAYHAELMSPERVMVADARLLYGYYSECATSTEDHELIPAETLALPGQAVGLVRTEAIANYRGFWGSVEGSVEPMSAHIRCSHKRMPRIAQGRDAFAAFQLYPQFTGVLSEIIFAAAANVAFLIALFIGVRTGRLNGIMTHDPETIFIVAILLAGLGAGFALYPKEQLITSLTLRPWRRIVTMLFGLAIAVPLTIIWGSNDKGLHIWYPALWAEVSLGVLLMVWLVAISIRPFMAETTGSQWRWQITGITVRRMGNSVRFLSLYKALDDPELVARLSRSRGRWKSRRDKRITRKRAKVEKKFADYYLIDSKQRRLFSQGIPPAVRHEHAERGPSG